MTSASEPLSQLTTGMPVVSPNGEVFRVDEQLAASFEPGDALVANAFAGLLRIPGAITATVDAAMTECAHAFSRMNQVTDEQIVGFFRTAAANLADTGVWDDIVETNAQDVERARSLGRSITRLQVSKAMQEAMIVGLNGWADLPSSRDAIFETVQHADFRIDLVGAALGPVGFVFEGRPNVLADACGVLRGGNTVIFRIGRDALQTAQTIMQRAITPALESNGLPAGAVVLVDSAEHAAGWSLFLDQRLALAVARGSGWAVDLLGSLAQSVGTPVSLHGTGGGWLVAGDSANPGEFGAAVLRSLERKVCNTMNVCVLPASRANELAPVLLRALDSAAQQRGAPYKLHVTPTAQACVPASLFDTEVEVIRAEGPVKEPQAEPLDTARLGEEWEWEDSPEITLTVCEDTAAAVDAFNQYSPRLVATLIAADSSEQQQFFAAIDAPFVGDDHTRWVDGQFALNKPELGLSNWANGRLFGRGAVLTGDGVFTIRTRYTKTPAV